MKVKLRFFGMLAFTHGAEQEIELVKETTWGETLDNIFFRFKLGQLHHVDGLPVVAPGYLLLFLNGKEQRPEAKIHEGDEILISHPLMGG